MKSLFWMFYRFGMGTVLFPLVIRVAQFLNSKENFLARKLGLSNLKKALEKNTSPSIVWFHAASMGELESLWMVALGQAKKTPVVLTVFSFSAIGAVEKLKNQIVQEGGQCIYAGISPWEGKWASCFNLLKCSLTFITVRYEAWPELWWSICQYGHQFASRLYILCASPRFSIRLALNFLKLFGFGPKLSLFLIALDSRQAKHLSDEIKSNVAHVQIDWAPDPRWDRVAARIGDFVHKKSSKVAALPRPWLIVGSAWIEDLQFLAPVLKGSEFKNRFLGTILVFPHEVSVLQIQKQVTYLQSLGERVHVLSQGEPKNQRWIIMDQMGALTEFYSQADLAWVGGGLGAGVHSTLEPALSLLPIAAGPQGMSRFPEVQSLIQTGQLTQVETQSQLQAWLNQYLYGLTQKSQWESSIHAQLGGTEKVLKWLNA